MSALPLHGGCDMLDSVCIADAGMRECLSFTGQLSHILLADAAAVYTFEDALSSPGAASVIFKAKRIVFFVSWLSFECKNAMRAIVAASAACEDVAVYSAVPLLDDDPMMEGLDCSCQHLPYTGRAFELQDVELLLFPSTATSVPTVTAPLCGRRDEMAQLLAAQLAGALYIIDFLALNCTLLRTLHVVSPTLHQSCVSVGAGSRNSALSMSSAMELCGQRARASSSAPPPRRAQMTRSSVS
jgi:hypothetical protein